MTARQIKVVAFLREPGAGRWWRAFEIADAIGAPVNGVSRTLGSLVRLGHVRREVKTYARFTAVQPVGERVAS